VKSSALRLGAKTVPALYFFYGATVAVLAMVGSVAELGIAYTVALVVAAAQLVWQIREGRIDDPADCLVKFKSNRLVGWLVLAGIGFGGL
jgi:4-hydroxybenzoate polyprenyltransferase